MRIAALAAALLLSGCAGPANDYATAANAYGAEVIDNTIKRRAEQNDAQLKAAEAEFCRGPSIGALVRRYDAGRLTAYLEFCNSVLGL